jgi:hypothetical protein
MSLAPPNLIANDRIPNRLVPRILLSNALFVFAVYSAKEWFLDLDVGVFWVLVRVLACGGLGVLVWAVITGQLARRDIEVCVCDPLAIECFALTSFLDGFSGRCWVPHQCSSLCSMAVFSSRCTGYRRLGEAVSLTGSIMLNCW